MAGNFQGGIAAGATSISVPVILRKTADNTELTGIAFGSITAYYQRQGAAPTALTAASALASATAAYSAGGWFEEDSTHTPGLYRLDVDNAAFAAGADWVVISVKVASAYVFYERYALTTNVPQTGDSYARLGAPAGASVSADIAAIKANTGALVTGVNVTQWNGSAIVAPNTAGVPLVDVKYFAGIAAALDANGLPKVDTADYGGFTVQLGLSNLPQVDVQGWRGFGVPAANVAGVPLVDLKYTLGTLSAGAAGYIAVDWAHMTGQAAAQNLSATTINLCNTITTYTGNTPQTGDSYARLGAPAGASVSADIAAIKANTGALVTGVTVSAYASGQDPATLVWAQAMTELVAVPSVTDTVLHALEWLFIVGHNKITETSATQTIRNHADTATISTSAVSDDGTTFTRGGYV